MSTPRIAVPAYIHPVAYADDWDRIIATGAPAVRFAVANVADGPGESHQRDWAGVIGRAAERGICVLGYVDTGYLGAPAGTPFKGVEGNWLARIRADVDAWYSLYGTSLGGIFFDRAHGSCDAAAVYRGLTGEVKSRRRAATSALNPGHRVPPCFAHAADVVVTFEGTQEQYQRLAPVIATGGEPSGTARSGTARSGTARSGAAQTWHLVYDVEPASAAGTFEVGRRQDAGYLYLTDQSCPNPWGRLVTYWDELVALARGAGGPTTDPGSLQERA